MRTFLGLLGMLGCLYAGFAGSGGFLLPAAIMLLLGVAFSVDSVALGPVLMDAAPEMYMGRIHGLTFPMMSLATLAGTAISTLLLNGAIPAWIDASSLPRLCFAISALLLITGGVLLFRIAKRGPN